MNKILTILAALLIAATGCAAPPAVNDVKVTQAVKVSPPTWDFHIFSPVANSLWGFDSSVLPVNVTIGTGLTLNATTHVLTAGVGSYQPLNITLTSLAGLADSAGLLSNDGLGGLSWAQGLSAATIQITNDTTTNGTVYPVWVSSATNPASPARVSNTKLTFNPFNGRITATTFAGNFSGGTISGSSVSGTTISGTTITAVGALIIPFHTPASSSEAAATGTITCDATYLYVWTDPTTNKRIALSTW